MLTHVGCLSSRDERIDGIACASASKVRFICLASNPLGRLIKEFVATNA